jgi:hypothetical protein
MSRSYRTTNHIIHIHCLIHIRRLADLGITVVDEKSVCLHWKRATPPKKSYSSASGLHRMHAMEILHSSLTIGEKQRLNAKGAMCTRVVHRWVVLEKVLACVLGCFEHGSSLVRTGVVHRRVTLESSGEVHRGHQSSLVCTRVILQRGFSMCCLGCCVHGAH